MEKVSKHLSLGPAAQKVERVGRAITLAGPYWAQADHENEARFEPCCTAPWHLFEFHGCRVIYTVHIQLLAKEMIKNKFKLSHVVLEMRKI